MKPASACPERRRFLLAAAALLPVACAGPQWVAAPATPVGPPQVRIGQRWRYREINRYNGQVRTELSAEVAQLAPQLRVSVTDASGKHRDDETYAGAWNVIQEPHYDITQVFLRPLPLLPDPPAAGACTFLARSYVAVVNRDVQLAWAERRCAVGWERVKVPAGEFLALRIERIIQFRHIDIFREDSTRHDTLWYAPEVNRWVQREWTGSYVIPGADFRPLYREDWVRWELLDYRAA